MLSELSAIFYSTELLIPPIPDFRVSKSKIVALYNKLREPGGNAYENLELQDIPTLSTRREGGKSICQISDKSIKIEENNPTTAMTVDEFSGVVKTILNAFGEDAVPFFLQRCTMQFTAQCHGSEDAVELLAGKLANVHDKIGPFERPPQFFGVRFRFSPVTLTTLDEEAKEPNGAAEETIEHNDFLTLRFESYSRDIKKIWMEVTAQYPQPIQANDLDQIGLNIEKTYDFAVKKAKPFLEQFDVKKEG